MDGELDFHDTLIICAAVDAARLGGSADHCPYTDARRKKIWHEAFNAYLDGQAIKNEPVRVAA